MLYSRLILVIASIIALDSVFAQLTILQATTLALTQLFLDLRVPSKPSQYA